MKKWILICLLPLLLLGSKIQAQSQEVYGKADIWFMQLTHFDICKKVSLGNELHMRFDNYFGNKQQFLFRPFVDYKFKENVIFSAGYTLIRTYPYSKYPAPATKPENNIWEQVTLKQKFNKLTIAHRYRYEQRWMGNLQYSAPENDYTVSDYTFGHRFRYRITFMYNFHKKWFAHIFDELWVKADKKFRSGSFDRNWVYAGLGYKITDYLNVQLAYLHQFVPKSANLLERHHGLQVSAVLHLKSKKAKQKD
jgi:hypothetical protein